MVDIKNEISSGSFGTVTIGCLIGIELDIALKRSKGYSQNTEGRVYQSLSGHPNFALTITGTDQNRPEPSRNRPEPTRTEQIQCSFNLGE